MLGWWRESELVSNCRGFRLSTLYLWKRQAVIDAGRSEGVKSFEADRLAQARLRPPPLYDEIEVIRPKGSTRLSEG